MYVADCVSHARDKPQAQSPFWPKEGLRLPCAMFTSPCEPVGDGGPLERAVVPYVPLYQRFLVRDKRFTQQYSHIYARRLDGMRVALRKVAEAAWGPAGQLPFVRMCCVGK